MATKIEFWKFTRQRVLPSLILSLLPGAVFAQPWQNITANAPAPLSAIRGGMVSDGERLFVLGGSNGTGVLVSSDGGNSFTPLNTVANAAYSLDDAGQVHGLGFANGRVWYMASSGDAAFNYLHSLAPGATEWEQAGLSGFPPPLQIGSFGAITDIVYVPESGLYFCIAELGGVYSSADGRNWEKRSNGFGGMGAVASIEAISGRVFAIRPLSGGPMVSADNGLSWSPVSPFNGFDGANLQRIGDTLVFLVPGGNSSTAYLGFDAGSDWMAQPNLPFGLHSQLNGDGQLLFSHRAVPTQLMFSASLGLTWQNLPSDGLLLNADGGSNVGVINPIFQVRHGEHLFLLGQEFINDSFQTESRLFRLNLSSVDLSADLVIVRQPQGFARVAGDRGSLSVFAVGEGLSYQWFLNGVAVEGATAASLNLGVLDESMGGDYTVTVSGSGTQVTSAVATVVVFPPRSDGEYDPAYEPEVTGGGPILGLPGGGLIRIGTSAPTSLDRIDGSGKLLNSRSLARSFSFEGFNPSHHIIDQEGRLVAAGFARGSDTSANQRLRRFLPDTLEDDPSFPARSGFSSRITGLAELPGRGYLVIGQFSTIAGTPVSRVALLSYSGAVDPDFASGLNLTPLGVVVGADGGIYLRGDFGGTPYRRMVRLDANGILVDGFGPITDLVQSMHPLRDGRVLLVSTVNGNFSVRIINPDGSPDPGFSAPGVFNGAILAVTEMSDGRIVLAGSFSAYNAAPAAGHIRLLPDGSVDPEYVASSGFSSGSIVSAVAVPGFVYFSSDGPASATFQGSSAFGAGPVRVFSGDRPADLRPFLGMDYLEAGDGYFFSPVLGWLFWDGHYGMVYSFSLRSFVYFLFDGDPIDSDHGFWMGIFRDDSFVWSFSHKLFWSENPNGSFSGYLHAYNGLDGSPGWFFFDAITMSFSPL